MTADNNGINLVEDYYNGMKDAMNEDKGCDV
jgi:hypothetical protein